MAEEVAAYVFDALVEWGFEAQAWAATAAYAATYAAAAYTLYSQQQAAQQRAKDAYNASLRDRYVMQRGATEQRAMVLGRVRVSGPMVFAKSYGTSSANLAFIVALAAHECDAIEDVYFNDERLILDSDGYVVGSMKQETFVIQAASASFTLAEPALTVTATVTYDTGDVTLTTSLSTDRLTVTVSGANASKIGSVRIEYRPQKSVYETTTLRNNRVTTTVTVTANASGFGSYAPAGITGLYNVSAVYRPASGPDQVLSTNTYPDNSMSFTGAPPGAQVLLSFQANGAIVSGSRARVRKYLGAAGQTADAGLISSLPSYWTSSHRGDGICYLVVELDYDPDAFPSGLPNVSAIVRGLKCYDPRTSTTAWTQNPALLMRAFWLHPLGANRSASEIDDTAVIAAANACDTQATYTLTTVGGTAIKYTRAIYTAGTVARKDRRAADVLNDLAQAMGGRWVVLNNTLRIRAGAYSTPVAAMDETWLHDGTAVQIQPRRNRADTINSTVGTFADAQRDYQALSYPKVTASAYVAADGRELQTDINYAAVTFVGQAQYLSAAALRYARAGMTVKMSCNIRAYPLEVFDVVTLSLARFGWSAKTFEVVDSSFSLDGLIELTLKEIDASIWTLDSSFSATDYAKKTTLPSPWIAEVPVLNTVQSGTSYLLKQADGTIVSRMYVSWAAISTPNVLNGGSIEIQWQRMGETVWQSRIVPGDATGEYIANVADGSAYLIRARSSTRLASSDWSTQQLHVVIGKSAAPSNVANLAAAVIPGAVRITWDQCPDADYDYTILRYGSTWAGGTTLKFNRPGTSYDWLWPASGTYTIWAVHVDTSGNQSTPVSSTVIVPTSAQAPAGQNRLPNSDQTVLNFLRTYTPNGGTFAQLVLTDANPYGWDTSNYVLRSGSLHSAALYQSARVTGSLDGTSLGGSLVACDLYFARQSTLDSLAAVVAGETVGASVYLASIRCIAQIYLVFYGVDGSAIQFVAGPSMPGATSGLANRLDLFQRLFVAATVPDGSVAAGMFVRKFDTFSGAEVDSFLWLAAPMLGAIAPGQTDPGPYVQAPAADTRQLGYNGDLNATRNLVTYSATAPSSPVDGDLWVDTSGTYAVFKLRSSGAWVTGANALSAYNALSGKPVALADINTTESSKLAGIAAGATKNVVTYSASAPSSPTDGDIWIDTSVTPRTIRMRLGGAWQLAGTYVNGTAQITDDANLGLTALWTGVTGTGKPADNATKNTVYFQDTDPGSVSDGSIWISSTKAWQRVGGAWQPYVGAGSVDTTQLATSAATDVTEFAFSSFSWSNIA